MSDARIVKRVIHLVLNPTTYLQHSSQTQWQAAVEVHTGWGQSRPHLITLSHLFSSYSLTVFSPSGKLVQIEHALAAVSSGTTSLGIKGVYRAREFAL